MYCCDGSKGTVSLTDYFSISYWVQTSNHKSLG
jgi:hypothetical protein